MVLYETRCCEVVSDINKTNTKSSSGIYQINSIIIKYVAPYMALPLSHIKISPLVKVNIISPLGIGKVTGKILSKLIRDFSNASL